MNDSNSDIERLLTVRGERLRDRPGLASRVYVASASSLETAPVAGQIGSTKSLRRRLAIAAALTIATAGMLVPLFNTPTPQQNDAPALVASDDSSAASDEVVVALLGGSETADLATDVPLGGLLEVRDMGVEDVHSEVLLVLATAGLGGTP